MTNRLRHLVVLGATLFYYYGCGHAAAGPSDPPLEKKVSPPTRLFYDEQSLRYNPAWKPQETYLETNLDNDADKEVILGFIASTKPTPERDDEMKSPLDKVKRDIPVEQNYAFYQIYDRDAGGRYQCVKTIHGMDRLGTAGEVLLEEKQPSALVILSPGGENYTNVVVLRWQEGGYRTLLDVGDNGEAAVLSSKNPVLIRLGPTTWGWNDVKKMFEPTRPKE